MENKLVKKLPSRLGLQNTPTAHNKRPGYDRKQSDDEIPVMLELWGMQSTPSLPIFPDLRWPRMVAPARALSMG